MNHFLSFPRLDASVLRHWDSPGRGAFVSAVQSGDRLHMGALVKESKSC